MHRDQQTTQPWHKLSRRLFLAGLVVASVGCKSLIERGQSPDDALGAKYKGSTKKGTHYVTDICRVYGLGNQKVHGVGLAISLPGTGSAAYESGQRKHLRRELKISNKYEDVDKMLASKDTELVILEGLIPAGAQEGERFDLEVVTMSDSDATSIANGLILPIELRPMARMGRGIKQGNIAGLAEGRILVNALFEARQDESNQLHGVVLGGGRNLKARPLSLQIVSDEFDQKTSMQIAQAINGRFTRRSSVGRDGIAAAKTDRSIELRVPNEYRNNIGRFASVVNQMAYAETPTQRQARLDLLDQQMSDPTQVALASLRLEAIGREAFPVLQNALKHRDFKVRFHASEAMAYGGMADGIKILAEAAGEQTRYRWRALTALSSLPGQEATDALTRLLNSPSAEARYGAFEGLRKQAPDHPLVSGEPIGGEFFLHQVASDAGPMVHFSRKLRPEIVVFGDEPRFTDDFLYVQSGLTIQSNANGTVTIAVYSADFDGDNKRTCESRVADVIKEMGEMGMGYSQQLKLIRQATEQGMLDARLVINARPKLRPADEVLVATPKESEADSKSQLSRWVPGWGAETRRGQSPGIREKIKQQSDASRKAVSDRFAKMKDWWNSTTTR